MKSLITLFAVFCSLNSFGQWDSVTVQPVRTITIGDTTGGLLSSGGVADSAWLSKHKLIILGIATSRQTIKIDTIRCVMLVSDTCAIKYVNIEMAMYHGYPTYDYYTKWQYGYIIKKWYDWKSEYEYLDDNKQPMKSIIVWMSKQLN